MVLNADAVLMMKVVYCVVWAAVVANDKEAANTRHARDLMQKAQTRFVEEESKVSALSLKVWEVEVARDTIAVEKQFLEESLRKELDAAKKDAEEAKKDVEDAMTSPDAGGLPKTCTRT